ncbi:hypothetical protein LC609_30090 [Nostoc sp. XA013]|nr:hypothetical protein [Nostoc sp. XA013]
MTLKCKLKPVLVHSFSCIPLTQQNGGGAGGTGGAGEDELLIIDQCPMPNAPCPMPHAPCPINSMAP